MEKNLGRQRGLLLASLNMRNNPTGMTQQILDPSPLPKDY